MDEKQIKANAIRRNEEGNGKTQRGRTLKSLEVIEQRKFGARRNQTELGGGFRGSN